jgi:hypothetical protein
MSHYRVTGSEVEEAALAWLEALGYDTMPGPDIPAESPAADRAGCELALRCWDRLLRASSCRLFGTLSKITQYVE